MWVGVRKCSKNDWTASTETLSERREVGFEFEDNWPGGRREVPHGVCGPLTIFMISRLYLGRATSWLNPSVPKSREILGALGSNELRPGRLAPWPMSVANIVRTRCHRPLGCESAANQSPGF